MIHIPILLCLDPRLYGCTARCGELSQPSCMYSLGSIFLATMISNEITCRLFVPTRLYYSTIMDNSQLSVTTHYRDTIVSISGCEPMFTILVEIVDTIQFLLFRCYAFLCRFFHMLHPKGVCNYYL